MGKDLRVRLTKAMQHHDVLELRQIRGLIIDPEDSIGSKKESIGSKELDFIVAASGNEVALLNGPILSHAESLIIRARQRIVSLDSDVRCLVLSRYDEMSKWVSHHAGILYRRRILILKVSEGYAEIPTIIGWHYPQEGEDPLHLNVEKGALRLDPRMLYSIAHQSPTMLQDGLAAFLQITPKPYWEENPLYRTRAKTEEFFERPSVQRFLKPVLHHLDRFHAKQG